MILCEHFHTSGQSELSEQRALVKGWLRTNMLEARNSVLLQRNLEISALEPFAYIAGSLESFSSTSLEKNCILYRIKVSFSLPAEARMGWDVNLSVWARSLIISEFLSWDIMPSYVHQVFTICPTEMGALETSMKIINKLINDLFSRPETSYVPSEYEYINCCV